MKTLLDNIEEAYRAGYNAACWTPDSGENQTKEDAWSNYKSRPAIQSLLDKACAWPRTLVCTDHGRSEPVAACKACLDAMQAFILRAKAQAEAAAVNRMMDAGRPTSVEGT